MNFLSRPFGILPGWSARATAHLDRRAAAEAPDDRFVARPTTLDKMGPHRAGVEAAIEQRMGAIQAGIEAQRQATATARVEALSPARCTEIERRIFNQVAVGGVRHGK
jgi:hypothetical protein